MKRVLLVLFVLTGIMTAESLAQDNMGIGTSTPEPSAVLDLDATDKGFLTPRLNTAQRTAIVAPATGLMVYDTDDNKFWYFDGTLWVQSVGPAGPAGADGQDGADGAQGPAGPAGADGQDGADGAQGPAGPVGPAGADGQDGADGAQGPAGPAGPAGADGQDGAQGPAGPVGPAGADGQDGADGAQGPAGPAGPAGADGQDGADGAQGPAGPVGPAGADGQDGVDGAQGPAGPAGPAGADGQDGADGAQGPAGPVGPAGADGQDGADGADGATGPTGATGPLVVGNINETLRHNGSDWEANDFLYNTGTNIGVGTTNPSIDVLLDLQGTVSQARLVDTDEGSELWLSAPGDGYTGGVGMNTDHDLPLYTNNIDRMTIKNTGEVGIGTAAPSEQFHTTDGVRFEGLPGTGDFVGIDGAGVLSRVSAASGPAGPAGPAGADGQDGVDGAQGPAGPAGPAGADGQDGADGAQGPAGPAGPAGADGQDGADGAQGPAGPAGPAGADGQDGADGAQGPAGPAGPAGADGQDGADGAQGPAGPINQVVGGFRSLNTAYSISTNGAWTNTGISVTVTSHGEPVFVSLAGHMVMEADYCGLAVRRAGIEIAGGFEEGYDYALAGWGATEKTLTVTGVDLAAPAGSNTYEVWMYVTDGGAASFLWNTNLSVIEVNNQ